MNQAERIAPLLEQAIAARQKSDDLTESLEDLLRELMPADEDDALFREIIQTFVADKAFDGDDPDGEGEALAGELLEKLSGRSEE